MTDPAQHSEPTWRAFIGPNANYYVRQWGVIEGTRPEFGFNWAAFFLSVGWMAYRRMYRRVIVLLAGL